METMNKYQCNAVEVALDTHIQNLYNLRNVFYINDCLGGVPVEKIQSLGLYYLQLIKSELKSEKRCMQESIDYESDPEEKKHWEELHRDIDGALIIIKQSIKKIKNGK